VAGVSSDDLSKAAPTTRPPTRPVPDNPDELRRDIEETRRELADTVEALSYKVDIKSRSQEKARELRSQVAEKARQVREQAATKVPHSPEEARELRAQVAEKARHVREQAATKMPHSPEEARGQAREIQRMMRDNPAVAAALVALVLWLLVLCGRRGRTEDSA
jgi:phage gp16-like protein